MASEVTLNVSKNVKRIKVNEAGEYIVMNLDDQTFIPRLIDLMKGFETAADEYMKKSAEIDSLPEETQQERMAKVAVSAAFNLEVCSMLKQKVDAAFQDEVCRKVFGDITPSVSAFAEFFEQLGALLKQFSAEKAEESQRKIAKYTEKYERGE